MLVDSGLEADDEEQGLGLLDLALPLVENLRLLIAGPLLAGLVALGITFIIAPTYTARTTLLPPQQQQSSASAALASLGALSGLAGLGPSLKSPAEQYVALMQSNTVTDRLIDQFKLMDVYEVKYREDARKELAKNVRISVGKKEGLLSVEVDDTSPQRAAELANAHVEELRRISGGLALSEAQQRRVFFESQLKQTRDRLTSAQQALQASGFTQGALKAEPKSAAEGYARLRAEATAAEIRLQALRRSLSDSAPEIQQAQATLGALRAELAQAERSSEVAGNGSADYVTKYREFKYQETLFELFARQYEAARVDEAREGALIQVVDPALQPEKKSKPKRAIATVLTTALTLMALMAFVVVRHFWRRSAADPQNAQKLVQLRAALRRS